VRSDIADCKAVILFLPMITWKANLKPPQQLLTFNTGELRILVCLLLLAASSKSVHKR
jgi:hypothetical protein